MDFFYYALISLFGLLIGSFVNAWEWRTRMRKPIVIARSECTHCGKGILWHDNIPIFSYLFLRGKCRHCQESISIQYPIVEAMSLVLHFISAWIHLGSGWTASSAWLVTRDSLAIVVLLFVFVYDLKYREIEPKIVLGFATVFALMNLFIFHKSILSIMIGMVVAGGFFGLQYVVSRGRWIGGGDIWLGVMMGALLGWPASLVALFIAYVGGAVVSLIMMLARRQKLLDETPFGTYLAVATLVTVWFGQGIIQWYMGMMK